MITAVLYDGRSSRPQAVTLAVAGDRLLVRGDSERDEPLAGVRFGERLGAAPRRIELADGGHCEVSDPAGFEALLTAAGQMPRLIDRAQRSGRIAAASLLFSLLLAVAGWRWGLPWLAETTARWVPDEVAGELGTQVLVQFDEHLLQPSQLPLATRQRLRARYAALGGSADHLLFRDGRMGANAFALPDGRVVLLDGLVHLAGNDDQVIAVLAHELGHVRGRHGLRLLIQSSLVAGVASVVFGDVSSLLVVAPTLVLNARYSRDFERAADEHAVALLQTQGLSPGLLADLLEKLQAQKPAQGEGAGFLASHPASSERIARLRRP